MHFVDVLVTTYSEVAKQQFELVKHSAALFIEQPLLSVTRTQTPNKDTVLFLT